MALGEPYRTLLGHMRHEAGHFYWDLLVADGGRIEECRAVFGDERESYAEALERYYQHGPKPGWEDALRQRLRHHASVGGLRRDLDPLPAHGRHARHRRGLRAVGQPARRRGPADAAVIDFDPYRPPDLDEPDPGLAAADRRGQQPEPQHGPAGPLSVRPQPERAGKGALHPRPLASRGALARCAGVSGATGDGSMRVFTCQNCGQLLHFENTVCMRCGMALGFLPAGRWRCRRSTARGRHRSTAWRTAATGGTAQTPDGALQLDGAGGRGGRLLPGLRAQPHDPRPVGARQRERWQALEAAKRRLIYALKRLGLPLESQEGGCGARARVRLPGRRRPRTSR